MSALLLGNLDGEADLARLLGGRRVSLPENALRTASALATLLRAFAEDGDRLWTPRPVAPERMLPAAGLPRPELVSGRDRRGDPIVPWLSVSELTARVHHRSFALETAAALGVALPGAKLLHSLHALDRHLADGGAAIAPEEAFVLKLPLSAAGRSRILSRGRRPDAAVEKRAARMLLEQDAFVFEPWLPRLADYGTTGSVGDGGPEDLRTHRLEVNAEGRFRGILLADPGPDGAELLRVAEGAGQALWREGYRGPFGVDAFRYRDATGRERLHPLAEINARLTFGHVARRLAERLSLPEGTALRTGAEDGTADAPGLRSIPLLGPGSEDATTARLVCRSRDAGMRPARPGFELD